MLYVILILISSILLWRLIRFFTTPILKKIGIYHYHSPMFFTVSLSENLFEIHLGTSWDFFKTQNINPRLQIFYLAQGLLNLCNKIEKGLISPKATFKGNIFYLKQSSINKFGFNIRNLNFFETILSFLNIVEASILLSFSYKRFTIINLNNFKVIYFTAFELLSNKKEIEKFLSRLTHNSSFTEKKNIYDYKNYDVA